jgi:hypothetical protein
MLSIQKSSVFILIAPRTHRERKELYIKALEQELLRLKEKYSVVAQDKDAIAEENRKLKQLLAQHGISWNGVGGVSEFAQTSSAGYNSNGSVSGSQGPHSTTYSPHSASPARTLDALSPHSGLNSSNGTSQQLQHRVDHEQAGIDFVLTYAPNPNRAYMSPPPQ